MASCSFLPRLNVSFLQSQWLERIVDAYLNVISAVCGNYNHALSGLLSKFIEFLCSFAAAVPRLRTLLTPRFRIFE